MKLTDLYHSPEVIHQHFLKSFPETEDLIEKAIQIEYFLADLFGIKLSYERPYKELLDFKRTFIQRYALKKFPYPKKKSQIPFLRNCDFSFMNYVKKCEIEGRQDLLDYVAEYAAYQFYEEENESILFQNPRPKGLRHLIKKDHSIQLPSKRQHQRKGFELQDPGLSEIEAQDQVKYCIKCHKTEKDSCSKGLKELTGCPLDQKISEMNFLKEIGHNIAALAVITLDNPMVCLTGHRICNDCRAACIFQKQDPVDVPGIETNILKTVLKMPYGFEIYSLLTRWNPLRAEHYYPKKSTGKTILIAGMGPAGMTLSHYLLNQGHTVVAIDGLKIEPWSEQWKNTNNLIENIEDVYSFPRGGFGGVSEYGITARWDKRFLIIARLLLERRERFYLKGSVRLGGQITYEDTLQFDHIALCMGSGSPYLLDIPNMLAPGVRMANDFLMSLHNHIPMNIEPPIVVIGGGLTAIDACTEAKAYCNAKDATVVYRREFEQSSGYLLNPEEIKKALEEGIAILENATPLRIEVDTQGKTSGLWVLCDTKERFIAAKTILIAIGTQSNVAHDLPPLNQLGKKFSILGDMNPLYSGSVVKAMQSSKQEALIINRLLSAGILSS